MPHHTKDKGDQGVGFVIADPLKAGIKPAILVTEHLPFDLIAVAPDGQLSRLSVKYCTAVGDTIVVNRRSCWTDRNGVYSRHPNKSGFGAVTVYGPNTCEVCYMCVDEFAKNLDSVSLRFAPAHNNQVSASDTASRRTASRAPCRR